MRITKSEEYGVRLVMSLCAGGGRATIAELAAAEGLPETTVAKVVARLRRAGLVSAERGRNGGYTLAAPAESVTLAEVVEALGGPLYDRGFCARMSPGEEGCSRAANCGLRPVWRSLRAMIGDYLAGITIAELAGGSAALSVVEPASTS